MEKLYYKNQYLKEFEAEITEIKIIKDKYHIALNKTAFFPGGGGQFSDLGELDGKKVLEVYEKDKKIYHVISKDNYEAISNLSYVKGRVNWNRREDGMHQHLAQHILSGCFFRLFNKNTVSVHFGKDISTVDIVGHLTEEEIRKAEEMANEIIRENIKVDFLTPSENELESFNLRRDLPNTEDEIRIVKIGDLDINACCGVHPNNTLELKMIKIKKHEKNKNNTRIEFLVGNRAIKDSLNKDKIIKEICNYLSSNEEEALSAIKNLKNNIENLLNEKRVLEEDLIKYESEQLISNSEKIGYIRIIKNIFEEKNIDYIKRLSNNLVNKNNIICLFAIKNKEKVNIIFTCSNNITSINMREVLKANIKNINGKGGGSKVLAQGLGENRELEFFLNNAYKGCMTVLDYR